MKPSSSLDKTQPVSHVLRQANAASFCQLFAQTQLIELLSDLLPDFRARAFTPLETLSLFLEQVLSPDGSCQQVLNGWLLQRNLDRLPLSSSNTGAYCLARKRLPFELVQQLAKGVGAMIDQEASNTWHWRGRRVRLVDGTTVTLADTEENQKQFPKQKQQSVGFPICRLCALICLGSGAVLNAATGPYQGKGSDEQSLLRSMLNTLNEGEILLGDAYYPTYFLLSELQRRGINGLFGQYGARKRSTDFSKGSRLGPKDHLITYTKPRRRPEWLSKADYDKAPDTLCVREFEVKGQILVTTLCCSKEYTKRSLHNLFKKRWNVELDLRDLKATLGMEHLRCKTPQMAMKELWVYLLAFNLVRWLMAQAARKAKVLPRWISFKHTVQLYLAWLDRGGLGIGLASLLRLIPTVLVGQRPGRLEPRALKRRLKTYRLLIRGRADERALIRQYGHTRRNVARLEEKHAA